MSKKTDTALTKTEGLAPMPQDVKGMLEHDLTRQQLQSVMPEDAKPERLFRLALSAIKQTPKLLQCSPASFFGSLVGACTLGLEVNTPAGEAYLVPYGKEAQLVIGYRGMAKMAYQHEHVVDITRHAVKEGDVFRLTYGTNEEIVHEIDHRVDRGATIGAYAIVRLRGGGKVQRYMALAEINAARPTHWKSTPWGDKNEYVVDEMRTKTALRRVLKDAPSTANARRAVAFDEASSRGASLHVDLANLTAEPTIVEPDQGPPPVDPGALEGPPVNGAPDPTEEAFKKLQPAARAKDWSDEDLEAALRGNGIEATAEELGVTL